jgi:hypothetical protein
MKKHIYFTLLFLLSIACQAQSPVYNISDVREGTEGSYYKDINGTLNGYDGTYVYTNGNTSLTIILKKMDLTYDGYYYQDLIVGEFQFIKDGVELNNTLANINVSYPYEVMNHVIKGNRILTGTTMGCPDCSPTEKRLRLSFIDNKSDNIAGLDIRKTTINGVPAIIVKVFSNGDVRSVNADNPGPPQLPPTIERGVYLMLKQ